MAKFKVIALSLGGLRNKIFSSGDVVTQAQLPVSVDELVAKGFLKPVEGYIAPSGKQHEPSIIDAVKSQAVQWPPIDEMTAKEIKEALGDKAPKVFTPKAELYALLVR